MVILLLGFILLLRDYLETPLGSPMTSTTTTKSSGRNSPATNSSSVLASEQSIQDTTGTPQSDRPLDQSVSENLLEYLRPEYLGCPTTTDELLREKELLLLPQISPAPCGHHRCFFSLVAEHPTTSSGLALNHHQLGGFLIAPATPDEIEDLWRSWRVGLYLAQEYHIPILALGPPAIIQFSNANANTTTTTSTSTTSTNSSSYFETKNNLLECLQARRTHSNVQLDHRMPNFTTTTTSNNNDNNFNENDASASLVLQAQIQVPEPSLKFQCNPGHVQKQLDRNLLPLLTAATTSADRKVQSPDDVLGKYTIVNGEDEDPRDIAVRDYWNKALFAAARAEDATTSTIVHEQQQHFLKRFQLEVKKAHYILEAEPYLAKGLQVLIGTEARFYYIDIAHGRNLTDTTSSTTTTTTATTQNAHATAVLDRKMQKKKRLCQRTLDIMSTFLEENLSKNVSS